MENSNIVIDTKDKERDKRIGFSPDIIVRAVGVFSGSAQEIATKQALLAKAKALQTPDKSPPVKLEREPDNKFDPNAVAVHVATDVNKDAKGNIVYTYSKVGYLPKGFSIPVRNVDGELFKKGTVYTKLGVWKLLDLLKEKKAPGKLLCGVNFVAKAENQKTYGLELGLKHDC